LDEERKRIAIEYDRLQAQLRSSMDFFRILSYQFKTSAHDSEPVSVQLSENLIDGVHSISLSIADTFNQSVVNINRFASIVATDL
jgi:hypothetical protein